MKRPENFEKIDNIKISVDGNIVLCDYDNFTGNKIFIFENNETNTWENVVLYEFDFENNQYSIKIVELGCGDDGWYYRKNVDIPISLFKSLDLFTEFIEITMENVFQNVDLDILGVNQGKTKAPIKVPIVHKVMSSDGTGHYDVTNLNDGTGVWTCSCKAFQYSKELIPTCKHIKLIKK